MRLRQWVIILQKLDELDERWISHWRCRQQRQMGWNGQVNGASAEGRVMW